VPSRIQYEADVGGLLEFYPREGVPTAATVVAYRSGYSELFAEGAVTLDTASQTVADVEHDATVISVADESAFVVGRRYILATDGGRRVDVEVIDKASGELTISEPPGFEIASGTIKGHGLRRTLSAAEAAVIRRNVRVLWEYTVAGVTYRKPQWIDIVAMPWALDVSAADMRGVYPTFTDVAGDGWRQWVAQAERDIWRALAAEGATPDLCVQREMLVDAACYRILALATTDEDGQEHDRWQRQYKDAIAQFVASRPWYDSDGDLVADIGGYSYHELADGTLVPDEDESLGNERGLKARMLGIG
jgi:hypothetical protein